MSNGLPIHVGDEIAGHRVVRVETWAQLGRRMLSISGVPIEGLSRRETVTVEMVGDSPDTAERNACDSAAAHFRRLGEREARV